MEKRKCTKTQVLEVEIVSMHKGGKKHKEIAEQLGLKRIQLKMGVAPLDVRHSP